MVLSNNKFTGTVPSNIRELYTSLDLLDVANNRLSGVIFPYITSAPTTSSGGTVELSALNYLDLSYNSFIGSLPTTVGWYVYTCICVYSWYGARLGQWKVVPLACI